MVTNNAVLNNNILHAYTSRCQITMWSKSSQVSSFHASPYLLRIWLMSLKGIFSIDELSLRKLGDVINIILPI